MARNKINIVAEFQKRRESYGNSSGKDKELKDLTDKIRRLRGDLEDAEAGCLTRIIKLASDAGLVFSNVESLKRSFPSYRFTTITANPDPGNARPERKPYQIVRGEDDDFHMEFYHCGTCKGWIPGEPLASSELHDSVIAKRETTYSCYFCGFSISREYAPPF